MAEIFIREVNKSVHFGQPQYVSDTVIAKHLKIAVKGMFHMKSTRMDILHMELSDRVNSLRPGDAYMRH